jgi:hypothetical protein
MAPYTINNPAAKAIVMMPDNPRPPQRLQLVPVQQPAAGAAGDRRDFFPLGPGDLRADGTRAAYWSTGAMWTACIQGAFL